MVEALLHFALGTLGALALSLLFARLAGESAMSAPFGVVFVGVVCASLAHFASPWATPLVLTLYGAAGALELRRT